MLCVFKCLVSLLRSKGCFSYHVLHEGEELHGSVSVSSVILQYNVRKEISPVIETCVAVIHGSWSSFPLIPLVPLSPLLCISAANTHLSTFFSC